LEGTKMNMCCKMLILGMLLITSISLVYADGQITLNRIEAEIYSYYYASIGGEWTEITTKTYEYDPLSFYDLHNIDINYNGNESSDPCFTTITQDSLGTNVEILHQSNNSRELFFFDKIGRKISYITITNMGYVSHYEYISYGTYMQPSGITIDNFHWIFHYDELDRKSTIDSYYQSHYQGYFEITYSTSTTPFPEPLNFDYPFNSQNMTMRTLFDANWPFDKIIYHPLADSADTLQWICDTSEGVLFSSSITPTNPWEDYYDEYYHFPNYGKVETASYSTGGMDYSQHEWTVYTWGNLVPNNDPMQAPQIILLAQNYPNPFSNSTTFKYILQKPSHVTIGVYNIKGQLVRTLEENNKTIGEHMQSWNADDRYGKKLASGIYIVRLQAGREVKTMKVMLVK
jgi:hypothetical protein